MGFFDSMKKGLQSEANRINESRDRSNYMTVSEREQEYFDHLNKHDSGTLMRKLKGSFTSDNEKKIIASILTQRNYIVRQNGKTQSVSEWLSEQ